MQALKATFVKDGKSRSVRIPERLIKKAGLGDHVEITVEKDQLIIKPSRNPREGWEEQIKAELAKPGKDIEFEEWPPTKFDQEEWEW